MEFLALGYSVAQPRPLAAIGGHWEKGSSFSLSLSSSVSLCFPHKQNLKITQHTDAIALYDSYNTEYRVKKKSLPCPLLLYPTLVPTPTREDSSLSTFMDLRKQMRDWCCGIASKATACSAGIAYSCMFVSQMFHF